MRVQTHLIGAFFVRGCKEYANKALSQNPAIAILFERVYEKYAKKGPVYGLIRKNDNNEGSSKPNMCIFCERVQTSMQKKP